MTLESRLSLLIQSKIESEETEQTKWLLNESRISLINRAIDSEICEHTRMIELADNLSAILNINIPAWEYPTIGKRKKLDELYQEVRMAFQA